MATRAGALAFACAALSGHARRLRIAEVATSQTDARLVFSRLAMTLLAIKPAAFSLKPNQPLARIRHGSSLMETVCERRRTAGAPSAPRAPRGPNMKEPEPMSFARIAKLPRPGLQAIGNVKFSPDGKKVLYLRSSEYGSLSRQVYAMDVETGKEEAVACSPPGTGEEGELSLEEKLRRERARIMNTGVTSFKVAGPKGSPGTILVPMAGALYVRDGVGESVPKRLFDPTAAPLGPGPVLDPQISKNGKLVCFVWSDELYCVPADGSSPPRQLSFGARGNGITHGVADFLAQEELDRYDGFWISPDGSKVVYEAVDEGHIPEYRIMHQGSDSVGAGDQEDHRYPFAGAANPKVTLYVVDVNGSSASSGAPPTKQFNITGPFGDDIYLARVKWLPDGSVIAQILDRLQENYALLRLDPATGEVRTILQEKTDVWVNVHDVLTPIGKTGKFLWLSEQTGFRHIYLYDPDAKAGLHPLTSGECIVEEVAAVDEKEGVVYFAGTSKGKWLEKHLFKVSLHGGEVTQLTSSAGIHNVVVDTERGSFVDITHSIDQPAVATLRSLSSGEELHTIYRNEDPAIKELGLKPPEFVTFPSADKKVTLQAALYKPDPEVYGPGPYPTVVSCYGGPHVQFVQNSWMLNVDLRAQALRSRGFLVAKVDNRGSNRRGLAFEGALKHVMGSVEVDDQVAVVKHCVAEGLCDPAKVGIYGWSYGGYLSAMCLATAGDVFKCAVSGAPVTSWDGYDTAYTERYMGTPLTNPAGYKSSSVMEHIKGMTGDLLLVHGLIDENVHFRHTARLINALIAEQKPYQLLLFPNERHSPRSAKDREYMEERISDFLHKSLCGS